MEKIRTAGRTDLRGIQNLIAAGVEEGLLLPRSKYDIRQSIGRQGFVVADNEGQLDGCVSLEVYNRHLGEVRSLYVAPAYRGNGIASQMILYLLDKPNVPERVVAITGTPDVFRQKGFGTMQAGKEVLFI